MLLEIKYSVGKKENKAISSYGSIMQCFFQARNAKNQLLNYAGMLAAHLISRYWYDVSGGVVDHVLLSCCVWGCT